jgi:hypothetical protein
MNTDEETAIGIQKSCKLPLTKEGKRKWHYSGFRSEKACRMVPCFQSSPKSHKVTAVSRPRPGREEKEMSGMTTQSPNNAREEVCIESKFPGCLSR